MGGGVILLLGCSAKWNFTGHWGRDEGVLGRGRHSPGGSGLAGCWGWGSFRSLATPAVIRAFSPCLGAISSCLGRQSLPCPGAFVESGGAWEAQICGALGLSAACSSLRLGGRWGSEQAPRLNEAEATGLGPEPALGRHPGECVCFRSG